MRRQSRRDFLFKGSAALAGLGAVWLGARCGGKNPASFSEEAAAPATASAVLTEAATNTPKVKAFDFARFHALALQGEPLEGLVGSFPGINRNPDPSELRIVRFSPNQDSPLEERVIMRGGDQALNVSAQVVSAKPVVVYWTIDGSLNGLGAGPTSVAIAQGRHESAKLWAVDQSGNVTVARLPTISRALARPPAPPSPTPGVGAHLNFHHHLYDYDQFEQIEAAIDQIRALGGQLIRLDCPWAALEPDHKGGTGPGLAGDLRPHGRGRLFTGPGITADPEQHSTMGFGRQRQ